MFEEWARQLADEKTAADPYPLYRTMRETEPMAWVPYLRWEGHHWIVTSYDLVDAVLKDAHVWKDGRRMNWEMEGPFSHSMLFQDPPDHTRLRGLVNRAFTPAMVSRLAPRIAEIVDWLADRLAGHDTVDFIEQFAMPLPVIVIAEILGVPAEDRDQFRVWSRHLIDGDREDGAEASTPRDAAGALAGYFDQLIRTKRSQPGSDLISVLLNLQDGTDRLSHEELLGMCVLLLVAGHETTVNLLGNGLYALLNHPAEERRLREDPALLDTAVEEMLRYDAPVQVGTFRYVGEPMTMGGHDLQPGQPLSAYLGAANRDPAQFPDPDRFDVSRRPNRHLAFGRGIHVCLGAPVARLEAQLAWAGLLARFSRITPDGSPVRRPNPMFRGFEHLPVRFES